MTADTNAPGASAAFEIEVISQLSEADYTKWMELRLARPRRARVRRWILTIIAIACFASWYTVALGVVLGLIAVAVWTAPRWMAWGSRKTYHEAEFLHGPLIYGMSSRGLWFRGGALRSECTWDGLKVWGERDGFFWLAAAGMPQLIFPVSTLTAAGIYERVRSLAAVHGVEYDSAAARAGRRTEVRTSAN